jgi:hypothetical protein
VAEIKIGDEDVERVLGELAVDPDDGTVVTGYGLAGEPIWGNPQEMARRILAVLVASGWRREADVAPLVAIDPDDLRMVLDQRAGHSHTRPGVWDSDNRPGLANTRCRECAARERLWALLSPVAAAPEVGTSVPPEVIGG